MPGNCHIQRHKMPPAKFYIGKWNYRSDSYCYLRIWTWKTKFKTVERNFFVGIDEIEDDGNVCVDDDYTSYLICEPSSTK